MKPSAQLMPCLLSLCSLIGCRPWPAAKPGPVAGMVIENQFVTYAIGANARNERFVDRRTSRNYATSNSSCAHIKRGGREFPATAASFKNGLLALQFADAKVEAGIRITVKSTHFLWEVVSLTRSNVEELVFADVPLTLHGSPD